jgi:hypothetical protein
MILARSKILAIMNMVFFVGVFVTAVAAEFLLTPPLYEGFDQLFPSVVQSSFPVMVSFIFLFNLSLSAFLVVTLPGFVVFPLSVVFLGFRAFLWGLLVFQLPTWALLIALPTILLEGEGYVFAAVAGMVVGTSWLKPQWLFGGENMGRIDSLKRALRECFLLYVVVIVLLLVAAIVETATIVAYVS